MGILLCEQNFRDVWRRNKSVRAEIGKILRTHTHTHAAKLVVRMRQKYFLNDYVTRWQKGCTCMHFVEHGMCKLNREG